MSAITVWKRLLRDGSGGREPVYSYRFRLHGKVHTRRTTTASRPIARRKAIDHIRTLEAGVHDQVAHLFRAKAAGLATVAELLAVHTEIGQGKPATAQAFRLCLRQVLGPGYIGISSSVINAEAVRAYKARVELAIKTEGADAARAQQMRRSANSVLAQARAMFGPVMLARYKEAGLTLPDLQPFTQEPGFTGLGRPAYRLPGDKIVAATLADLPRLAEADRNAYIGVWLILGFGLRKSELAGLRVRDLEQIRGRWHAIITETWPGRRRCTTTKNRDTAPKIPVANGAWEHIAPFIITKAAEEYVLAGNLVARLDYTAQAIGAWMRRLGWTSQKTLHELRSWAICQVGYAAQAAGMDPLETMRGWARHGSRAITETHYGRYFTNTAPDSPIKL